MSSIHKKFVKKFIKMEYWKYHVVDEVELETIEETELKLIVGF